MSLKTVTWVLLAVVGVAVLLLSLVSANLAYRGDFPISGVFIADIAAGRDAVAQGLRGARGTAAGWAAAWAALFLGVVFGPYRRGDVATWWSILISSLPSNDVTPSMSRHRQGIAGHASILHERGLDVFGLPPSVAETLLTFIVSRCRLAWHGGNIHQLDPGHGLQFPAPGTIGPSACFRGSSTGAPHAHSPRDAQVIGREVGLGGNLE